MTNIDVTDEAGNSRTITPTNISWMLFTGWMFYIGSQVLNFIYYLMHPSSPELFTWGKEEKLEGWTPPGETQPQDEEEGECEWISTMNFVLTSDKTFLENIDEGKNILEQSKALKEEGDIEIKVL